MGSSTWSRWSGSGSSLGLSTSTSVAVGQVGPVGHRRGGGDEREVELPLEPLADDLHVQEPEEAAPESEPEGPGRLRLVGEAGVVEPELLQRVAQVGQLVAVDGEQPAEHHGLGVAVPGQGGGGRVGGRGDRLAGAGPADVLDPGDQVADLARAELVHGHGRSGCGRRSPRSRGCWPACMNRSRSVPTRVPSITRIELTTPRYWS